MPASDQGVYKDRYKLIPRTLIFIIRGESVLLIKGAAHKPLWADRYNGVGGHIERGEDILSAAKRELMEETGLIPEDLWLCGTVTVDTGENIGIGLYVMKGSNSTGIPQPSPEGELEWIPFSKIKTIPLVEDLSVLLPKVISSSIADPPFSAHYHYDKNDKLVVDFAEKN